LGGLDAVHSGHGEIDEHEVDALVRSPQDLERLAAAAPLSKIWCDMPSAGMVPNHPGRLHPLGSSVSSAAVAASAWILMELPSRSKIVTFRAPWRRSLRAANHADFADRRFIGVDPASSALRMT